MEDRCLFFDSKTYFDYGIEKRENLKANSPGSSESCTGSRTSFFLHLPISASINVRKLRRVVSFFVAEPIEIPIFRIPEGPYWQKDSYIKEVEKSLFFNST